MPARLDYIFLTLAAFYMVTSILIVGLVRRHYSKFYEDHGQKIITATFFLTVPLLFSGLSILYYLKEGSYYDYLRKNGYFMIPVHIIVTALIPIVTQIFTLVFGYSRLKSQ